jgi:cyclic-di-GMP-binding protein
MDVLLLTTPPQHTAHNPKAELNPKRLKAWLEQLPVMNVADTVRHLQMALQAINEVPVAPGERFKLMELYGAFFNDSVSYYDQMRVRSLSIKEAQRSALLQDVLWLYLNLANGYKIIVKEFFDAHTNPARDAV